MDPLLWLQEKANATLVLALVGAVNGTLGLILSFLSRRDTVAHAQRQEAQRAPWAALRIESGDHRACLMRATFFNPSERAIVVTRMTIERPASRQVILLRPDPTDLLGPLLPDSRGAGRSIALNWTVKAMPGSPEKPAFQDEFIVAEPPWSAETRERWRPASRMRETLVTIRFTGHTLAAGQEPVDLLVRATNDLGEHKGRTRVYRMRPAKRPV